jgi:molybdate transport system ATP-binding protein
MTLDFNIHLTRPGFELRLNLALPPDQTIVLLGPSGSGKSTLLRTLAGLERPRSGRIAIGERIWFDSHTGVDLPARRRRAGLVFQHYALFPHLSVARNIAFALPGLSRTARRNRVAFWLEHLRLSEFAQVSPEHLSGGQRQRVALARALAAEPEVLLLDEPFSAVDAELRQHLRQLFREVATDRPRPRLLVTHDLEDVRELADCIGVLVAGELRRFGSAHEVLAEPRDLEVAQVLGWQNLLPVADLDRDWVCGSWGRLPGPIPRPGDLPAGRPWLGIEPRHLRLAEEDGLAATVEYSRPLGPYRQITCRLCDGRILQLHRRHEEPQLKPGQRLNLTLEPRHLILLSER